MSLTPGGFPTLFLVWSDEGVVSCRPCMETGVAFFGSNLKASPTRQNPVALQSRSPEACRNICYEDDECRLEHSTISWRAFLTKK